MKKLFNRTLSILLAFTFVLGTSLSVLAASYDEGLDADEITNSSCASISSNETITITDTKYYYFRFKPTVSGYYYVNTYSEDSGADPECNIYEFDGTSVDEETLVECNDFGDESCFVYMSSSTSYVLEVYNDGDACSYMFTITAETVPEDLSFNVKTTNFYMYQKYNFSTYLETSTKRAGLSSKFIEWTSSNTSVATVDENGVARFCGVGNNVTITATSKADPSVSATYTFSVLESPTLTTGTAKTVTLTSASDGYAYFKFNPTSDGRYSLHITTNDPTEKAYCYFYTASDSGYNAVSCISSYVTGNVCNVMSNLKKGTTYYAMVFSELDNVASLNVKVEVGAGNDMAVKNLLGSAKSYRSSGATRYETAIKNADSLKAIYGTSKFDTIIVASGANFPDALSGSMIGHYYSAPILLTNPSSGADNSAVYNYIKNNLNKGGTVVVLGGNAAVPSSIVSKIKAISISGVKVNVDQLSGDTRYDTNLAILKYVEAESNASTLLVCSGTAYADAISAAAVPYPLLIVNPSGHLTDAQKTYLAKCKFKNIIILGGKASVPESYIKELSSYATNGVTSSNRIYGDDRYLTSKAIALSLTDNTSGFSTVVLAAGTNFPDGLTSGTIAGALNAPIVLLDAKTSSAAKAYISKSGKNKAVVIGGTSVVTNATVNSVMGW